jgi:hypothetical protein
MNKKFWEAARPGDDIRVICHPGDEDELGEMLKPLAVAVKLFGPFPVLTSPYVEQGTILFLNKTKREKPMGWPDWAKDLKFVGPLINPPGMIRTDVA